MKEVAVLFNGGGITIHWHDVPESSAGFTPDSYSLWDVIWAERRNLYGIAHTHPGSGFPGPSSEDLTTFKAVEHGLGKRLIWPIVTTDSIAIVTFDPLRNEYVINKQSWAPFNDVHELRVRSGLREVNYG